MVNDHRRPWTAISKDLQMHCRSLKVKTYDSVKQTVRLMLSNKLRCHVTYGACQTVQKKNYVATAQMKRTKTLLLKNMSPILVFNRFLLSIFLIYTYYLFLFCIGTRIFHVTRIIRNDISQLIKKSCKFCYVYLSYNKYL